MTYCSNCGISDFIVSEDYKAMDEGRLIIFTHIHYPYPEEGIPFCHACEPMDNCKVCQEYLKTYTLEQLKKSFMFLEN